MASVFDKYQPIGNIHSQSNLPAVDDEPTVKYGKPEKYTRTKEVKIQGGDTMIYYYNAAGDVVAGERKKADSLFDKYKISSPIPQQKQSFGSRFLQNLLRAPKQVLLEPAVGAAKGALSTISGASELGQRGLQKITGVQAPVSKISERFTKPIGTGQQAGFAAEQIGEFFIPGSKIAKAEKAAEAFVQASKIIPKVLKPITKLGTRSAIEAGTAAGITSIQQGKVGEEAKTAALIGGAVPVAGSVLKKILGPKVLISKAMGLTPTQKRNLSQKAVKGGYEDINDFALQKGFIGGREEMTGQIGEAYSKAIGSKKDLLKNVKDLTKNKYQELTDALYKIYSVPGQSKNLGRIKELANKKMLTAQELDELRYLADSSLPTGAYRGAEPPKTKGMENLIDEIRNRLAKIEPTGTLRRINTDIRVLYDLIPLMSQSAQRSLAGQLFFRGGLGGGVAIGAKMLSPIAGPLAAGAAGLEILRSIPQVSSTLAQILKKASQKAPVITRRIFGR